MVTFQADEYNSLSHYGTPRHSGRYPWGSGEDDSGAQRSRSLLDQIATLKAKGLSDPEIAEGLGMKTTEFRQQRSIAKSAARAADVAMAYRLREEKNYSNVEIGRIMNRPESSVRALLAQNNQTKADSIETISNMLRDQVNTRGTIDVGKGVEYHLGVSKERLATAVRVLENEGYAVHPVQISQIGTSNKTTILTVSPKGTTYRDIVTDTSKINSLVPYSEDGGRTLLNIVPPLSISSKRIGINYKEDGGAQADGVIYVRPGVEDVSIGGARYAQVRVAVDGTHYLKGMAMYHDKLPDGVDLVFNTNKSDKGDKLAAMKPMQTKDGKIDPDNPFGSVINRQIIAFDKHGKEYTTSAMNLVNEEGKWQDWKKSLSTQVLSKQAPERAQKQVDLTYAIKKEELDEIMSLTNPTVKKKLLESYADGADSSAVHLKAAALPRQGSHVILPINTLKDTEVYAPNYRDGERVALIRYPHGGIFEIPELTVNNRHPEAKRLLKDATDAIGINHKVAERLSGADFDGDTVLVIPNPRGTRIKSKPPLDKLKDFDAKAAYPKYEGMKIMDEETKGHQMGLVSNLITDMTIKGANDNEIAQAVRHSMVVIDAVKHELNYKQSAIDNNIPHLMKRYQKRSQGGSATIISKATSIDRVPEQKLRAARRGGPIDPETGKLIYEQTGGSYISKSGKVVELKTKVEKLANTDNAHTLVSDGKFPVERIYADHSNRLKALANQARKASLETGGIKQDPAAKKVYADEVAQLDKALYEAFKNAPRERQAQVIANATVAMKRQANPDMEKDELKKIKYQALEAARNRTDASKAKIRPTQRQWEAIQAGAISNKKLRDILDNADLDHIKQLATPRTTVLMTSSKLARANAMKASGHTQAEIADALGVSLTTLKNGLKGD